MLVPDQVRKCVCFVGYTVAGGETYLAGTAFLFSKPVEGHENRVFFYMVTARHVIDKIRDLGIDKVDLRLNLTSAAKTALAAKIQGEAVENVIWMETSVRDWFYHPSDDRAFDVAVLRWRVDLQHHIELRSVPLKMAATEETLTKTGVGTGDEVFLPGLFRPHYGLTKNIPIIRIGNIAAMPEEPIITRVGKFHGYLIEARSIGGLSGSPVFVQIGGIRGGTIRGPQFYLLGLMHGHFDTAVLPDVMEDAQELNDKVNMGIGIVVPVETILETLNHPIIRREEAQITKQLDDATLLTSDVATETFTKDDFADALKKVSQKLRPSKSDEGKS